MNLFEKYIHNISMTRKLPAYLFVFMVSLTFLSSVLVYPIFSKFANLSQKDVQIINNYYETELSTGEEPTTITDTPEGSKIDVKVSILDWFDTVNTLFPTYTKTRVIDIYSGTTYYVYRNGGHYHADVEPIDQENTDIFYKIYNYNWSWARRPVWVEINPDVWVAGSINGYPHGNSYIKNTGMPGHTCIHFLQSKTHGTKRVDEAHQNCVAYAYEHSNEIVEYLI